MPASLVIPRGLSESDFPGLKRIAGGRMAYWIVLFGGRGRINVTTEGDWLGITDFY